MRAPNLSSVEYTPGPVPANAADIPRYLREEFDKIAAAVSLIAAGMAVAYVVPDKPRDGMLRTFDGVQANPTGAGGGLHRYDGQTAQWIRLG